MALSVLGPTPKPTWRGWAYLRVGGRSFGEGGCRGSFTPTPPSLAAPSFPLYLPKKAIKRFSPALWGLRLGRLGRVQGAAMTAVGGVWDSPRPFWGGLGLSPDRRAFLQVDETDGQGRIWPRGCAHVDGRPPRATPDRAAWQLCPSVGWGVARPGVAASPRNVTAGAGSRRSGSSSGSSGPAEDPRILGDPKPMAGAPWAQGQRLAPPVLDRGWASVDLRQGPWPPPPALHRPPTPLPPLHAPQDQDTPSPKTLLVAQFGEGECLGAKPFPPSPLEDLG